MSEEYNEYFEKKFIDGLGTHAKELKDKQNLYQKYINALRKRSQWDGMDKDKIIGYAMKKWAENEKPIRMTG